MGVTSATPTPAAPTTTNEFTVTVSISAPNRSSSTAYTITRTELPACVRLPKNKSSRWSQVAHFAAMNIASERSGFGSAKHAQTCASRCLRCGEAGHSAFNQQGGALHCNTCGATNHKRTVESTGGESWMLLRGGSVAEVVSVFTGSREYAESLVAGRLMLFPSMSAKVGECVDMIDGQPGGEFY